MLHFKIANLESISGEKKAKEIKKKRETNLRARK